MEGQCKLWRVLNGAPFVFALSIRPEMSVPSLALKPPQRLAELHRHVTRDTSRWVGSHSPVSEGGERPGQLSQTGQLSRAFRAPCSVSSYHSWAFVVARRLPLHPASLTSWKGSCGYWSQGYSLLNILLLNPVSESVSWWLQFGSLEDRDEITEFGCFPIGNKRPLRWFECRSNKLKAAYLMFDLASVWITQRRVWSDHDARVNEARSNRYSWNSGRQTDHCRLQLCGLGKFLSLFKP